MKSIKPGRGPSKMDAVFSFAFALFGLFWTGSAMDMGATIMVPFGLIFVGLGIYMGVYSLKNATSEERYSIVDIVDEDEEGDPLNRKYGKKKDFCLYCGERVDGDFDFCPKCGKKLNK